MAVDMRALVLSVHDAGSAELHAIETLLEGIGIPYDVVNVVSHEEVSSGGLLSLKHADGNRGKVCCRLQLLRRL